MDQNNNVSVGSLLSSVAGMLNKNAQGINSTDAQHGGGSHGNRMAQAFQAAAQAANQSQSSDAGDQFEQAAQALRQQGTGKAVQFYANGLDTAAQQFKGKQGLSSSDVLPLLQSLANGAQQNNPAKPGQGTMLDALLPAVQGYMGAQNQGMDAQQAAIHALGGAVQGAQSTTTLARSGGSSSGNFMDPGAASATSVIGGIIGALLPHVLSSVMSGVLGGGQKSTTQATTQPASTSHKRGTPIHLGDQSSSQASSSASDPLGGLGGLLGNLGGLGALGGLLGGSGQSSQSSQSPLGALGGLLGGGSQSSQSSQSALGGLGGLLGGDSPLSGLFGGGEEEEDNKGNQRYV